MKLSKSLFAALSSLCLLNACGDWTSFTANDCSQDEGAKIFDNAYYICDEFNHWKQIIPKCKPGETRFVETKDGSCIQQECTNLLSWPSTSNIPTPNDGSNRSCVRQNGSFTQIGECLNGKSSCDEEGAKTDTPYRICSNGQRFEFGVCGCDSTTDSSCSNVNESTGVTCIDGMLKTCTQKDTNEIVSCNESTGQCGECLNGKSFCDGDMLKTCQNGKWIGKTCPRGCENNQCLPVCNQGDKICSIEHNSILVCNSNEWQPQTCKNNQICDNAECIDKTEFKCEVNAKCEDDKLYKCTNNGFILDNECTQKDQICDSEKNDCIDKPECETDTFTCSDNKLMICKDEKWTEHEEKCKLGCKAAQCVECNNNVQCEEGNVCSNGKCVECVGDNCKLDKPECENGMQKCEQNILMACENGTWVDNAHCQTPTPVCDVNAGKCVECNNDTQCKEGKVCDEGKCVEKCTESSCDNQICNPQTGQCVECIDDEQCSENGTLNICNNGKCVECNDNTNCNDSSKPICNMESGQCIECSDNNCKAIDETKPICNIESRQCVECNDDNQCEAGKVCVDDQCVPCNGNNCGQETSECEYGMQKCEQNILRTCENGTWVDNAHCQNPTPVCDANAGQCVKCDNNHQCPGEGTQNICDGGQCIECNLNNKNDTRCIWDKGIQYTCDQNSDTKAYKWRELANNTDSSFQRQCQCEDDDQCKLLGALVCDINTNRCVECNRNADCPGENTICFENTCKENNTFYCENGNTIAYFTIENNENFITKPPCDNCIKNRDNSFYCSNPEDICNPSSDTKPDPRKPCIKCSGNEVIPTLCKSNEVCRYTDTDGNKCLPYCETNQTCIADPPYSICVDDICQEISDSITLPPPKVCDSNSSEIQSYCVNNPMTGQTDIAVCSNKKYKQYSCGPGRTCKDGKCIEKCDEPESVQCFYDNKASNPYTVNTTSYMQFNACNSTTVKEGHSMWNNYIYPPSAYNNQTELCVNNSLNIEIDELKSNAISTHCSLQITTDSNSSTIYINGIDIKCDGRSLCYMGKCLNIMDTKTSYPSTSCVECKRPTSDPTIHDTILDHIPTHGLNPQNLNKDEFWCGEGNYSDRILIQTSNENLLLFCPEGQTCRGGECK